MLHFPTIIKRDRMLMEGLCISFRSLQVEMNQLYPRAREPQSLPSLRLVLMDGSPSFTAEITRVSRKPEYSRCLQEKRKGLPEADFHILILSKCTYPREMQSGPLKGTGMRLLPAMLSALHHLRLLAGSHSIARSCDAASHLCFNHPKIQRRY